MNRWMAVKFYDPGLEIPHLAVVAEKTDVSQAIAA